LKLIVAGPFAQLSPLRSICAVAVDIRRADLRRSRTKVSDVCTIVDGGDVWCWSDAQADYTNDLSIPAKVEGLNSIVQVEGESTACALDANGAVFCWGDGDAYEIGDGEFHGDRAVTPAPVLSFP
jgi:hypothetical protein